MLTIKKILIIFSAILLLCSCSNSEDELERQSTMAQLRGMNRIIVDAKAAGTKFETPFGDNEWHYFALPAEGGELEIPFGVPSAVYAAAVINNSNLMMVEPEKGIDIYGNQNEGWTDYERYSYFHSFHGYSTINDYFWFFDRTVKTYDGFSIESIQPESLKVAVEPNPEASLRCLHLAVGWAYDIPHKTKPSEIWYFCPYPPSPYPFNEITPDKYRKVYMNDIYIFQEGTEGIDSQSYWQTHHHH